MHYVSLIMYSPYCLPRQWLIPQGIAYMYTCTSVMNTYSVLFLFLLLCFSFLTPLAHQVSPGFRFPFFFLSYRLDSNQRFPGALAYLSLFHTTRPRRLLEISWLKNRYLFACPSLNIQDKTTEICIHVSYSRFCL